MVFLLKHQLLMSYSVKVSKLLTTRMLNTTSSAVNLTKVPLSVSNSGRVSVPQFSRQLHSSSTARKGEKVTIHVKTEDDAVTLQGDVGDSILDLVVDNEFEIIGYGACEGTIACSTCHCILEEKYYAHHNSGKTEEEKDLLDMITLVKKKTSRLGCQVYLSKASDGMEVFIPPPVDIRED